MTSAPSPDLSCYPYRRKTWYLILTLPFLFLMMVIAVSLWAYSPLLTAGMLVLFGMTCLGQAYCCAYQDCPYIGGFCPGVIGIMPAAWIAKVLYSNRTVEKSQARFKRNVTLAMTGWIGLIVLPLYWLAKLGIGYAAGYVAAHAVYAVLFGLTVCPVCAIRNTCPGGKFHRLFRKD